MFKKLRIKFIAITMVMVAIVMAFAFTVVCVVEYQRSYSVVQTALENAVDEAIISVNRMKDGRGMMPKGMRQDPPSGSGNASASSSSSGSDSTSGSSANPDAGSDPASGTNPNPTAGTGTASASSSASAGTGTASASSSASAGTGTASASSSASAAAAEAALPMPFKPAQAYADEPQAGQGGQNGDPSRNGRQSDGNAQNPQANQDPQNPREAPDPNAPGRNSSGGDQAANPAEGPSQPSSETGGGQEGSGSAPASDPANTANETDTASEPDGAEGDEDDRDGGTSSGSSVKKQANASESASQSESGSSSAGSENGSGQSASVLDARSEAAADAGANGQDSVTISDEDMGQTAPPSIGNRPGQQRPSASIVPVAVYRIDANGTLRVVPEITTASISEDVLQEAADLAIQTEDGFGTFSDLGLHYYKTENDGTTYLAFADTSYTDTWQSLALILTGSGVGTLAVFFVVALFYSRWALRPVKEAWDSQRQFVADASHDLKTPLTVILANAAILLKHPEHTIASESQWIENTQKEAEEMQGLVNEMLELAQIEAGQQIELVREPIDLSDLIDGETLLFDSVALERGCGFNCSIEQGAQILGDEKQVKKLVSTLVENAFKYVDEAGTIDIVLRKAGKMATVDIHNTGSTISAEDLPHLFDRFYRTDKARTSGTGGFGLGLAIAREIARQHNGDITCKSSPEDGTTFTITLPLA